MRELKFRWWNDDREEMEYFDFLMADCYHWLDDVMQYTGLKDKNGKEIYEGDICEHMIGCERERWIEVNGDTKGTWVKIVWLRSAWGFESLFTDKVHPDDIEPKAFYVHPFEGDDWDSAVMEVIGNIYENPELLESETS